MIEERHIGLVLLLVAVLALATGAAAGPPSAAGASAASAPAAVASTWPGDTKGLVFLWQDASRTNQLSAAGRGLRTCRLRPAGLAFYGRFFEMTLAGGGFRAEASLDGNDEDIGEALLAACRASGELTLEATIAPDDLEQTGPAAIIAFGPPAPPAPPGPPDRRERPGSAGFILAQERDKLVLMVGGSPPPASPSPPTLPTSPRSSGPASGPAPRALCGLAAGRPQHIIVTCRAGKAACWLDGEQAAVAEGLDLRPRSWSAGGLTFGQDPAGGRPWFGRLEGVAIYARAVSAGEARAKWLLYRPRLAERRPARRLVIEGTCLRVPPAPSPDTIRRYPQCLGFHTYQVRRVIEGQCRDVRIQVAHWVMLDRKPVPPARQKGTTYTLTLEAMDDHPELKTAWKARDEDEFGLAEYYDVGRPGR